MKEINFYCIEEDINGFLHNFLSKLVEKNKKVFIYSENIEKMEKLDNMLWTLKKVDFLPHSLYNDIGSEKTPIIISNQKDNKNQSNFILISSFLDDTVFLDSFEKTFYIFSPINQSIIENVKNNWNKYKKIGFHEKLLKKDNDGKWKEYGDFII